MMKFLNNITQEKNILIISFFAGILATPVFFATIGFFVKIAIIASVVIATYLALSIPSFLKKFRAEKNDVSAKTEEQSDVSGDDIDAGYGSGSGSVNESEDEDKEDIEISPEEQEKTEFQVQEELNTRECKRMEEGSLGGPINGLGEPINSGPSNEIPAKIVMKSLPDHMDLYGNELPDEVIYTEDSHLVCESQKPKQDSYVPMESLPDSMDVLGNKLPYSPSTYINMNSKPEQRTQKQLSPAEWLSQNAPWVLKQCSVRMPATTEDILNQRG